MSTVVEKLPASGRALAAIAEANSWEHDRAVAASQSQRRSALVGTVGLVFGLMGMGMGLFMSLRPATPPVVIEVDRTTGQTVVVPALTADNVPRILAADQHNAWVYVRAREAYVFNLLKRDYEQVARMSSPETFAPYSAKFTGEGAMQNRVGTTQEHLVTLVSVRPSSTTLAGRNGEMIVTFDREIRYSQGLTPNTTRHVATVRYEYRPESMKKDVDRIENPLGFVVLTYRTESELVSPNPAAAADAGARPRS